MTAQATCPGAGADTHLCVGRHAELPNSERCQVKNTSVFKDKIPGSPWNSVHSISWGSGAGVTPPALFQGSGFLPPLFNESCSQTPNQPLRTGVGGPLPLAGWGSVFLGREASRRVPRPARAEQHVGRPPGRWRSGQWQLVPAVGKPFPPGPGGQGARGPGGRGARVALRVPQGLSEVRAWAAACFVCLLPTRKRPLGWQGPSGEGPGARPGVSPRFRRGGGLQLRCSWISRHPPLAPDPSPFHGVLSPACPGRPCEGGACWSAWVGCPGAEPCVGWGPEGRGSRVPGLRSGGGVPFAAERLRRPAWASSSRSLFVSTPPSLSCLPHACHLPICSVRASGPRGPCRGPGGG